MSILKNMEAEAKRVAQKMASQVSQIDMKKIKETASDIALQATKKVNTFTRTVPRSTPPPIPMQAMGFATDGMPPPLPPEALLQKQEVLDVDALKSKAQELLGQAKRKAVHVKDQVVEKTDATAEAVAKKVSEKTGFNVTPGQVKKVALVAGVTLIAVGAADLIADAVMEGGMDGGLEFGGEALSGSGDVIGDAGRVIAENGGSFNIDYVTVDMDGCQI